MGAQRNNAGGFYVDLSGNVWSFPRASSSSNLEKASLVGKVTLDDSRSVIDDIATRFGIGRGSVVACYMVDYRNLTSLPRQCRCISTTGALALDYVERELKQSGRREGAGQFYVLHQEGSRCAMSLMDYDGEALEVVDLFVAMRDAESEVAFLHRVLKHFSSDLHKSGEVALLYLSDDEDFHQHLSDAHLIQHRNDKSLASI